jgi:MFS transporter, DHA3 family, macrolide efflux protein
MTQKTSSSSMTNFMIVWSGQLISNIGSTMTTFAINIWTWELTNQVTSLALVDFFSLLPSIFFTPFSGIIVDRSNRKLLMILGDTVAVTATVAVILLYFTKNLQIWHFYFISAVVGTFSQLQWLAYSASVSLMIPKQHYTRAISLESLSGYSANIIAPALAGYLYYIIGLAGICLIDIATFAIAIITVFLACIPKPEVSETEHSVTVNIWQELGFGLQYIRNRKGLFVLLLVSALFWFSHDISDALYTPMILSRTGNNTLILGSLASAAGFGGVLGSLIITIGGGFRQKIKGVLLGMMGGGLFKMIFGLGQTPWFWIPAQFCASLNFPLNGSSTTAIWLAKIPPNIQGRVFAARSLLDQLVSATAYLTAGILADNIFTPAFSQASIFVRIFGGIFGTGRPGGIAMLYVISAICMFLVGLLGFYFPLLRDMEKTLPDHDTTVP